MDFREFIENNSKDKTDYPQAFKLLGLIVYIAQYGNEPLLSGDLISRQTYYRWVEKIKESGYGDLLVEVRLRQVLTDFINQRFGNSPSPNNLDQILKVVNRTLGEIIS